MLVSGWQQAVTLLLAVIPGFVYQVVRTYLRGPTPDEREIGVRILRALAVSGFLAIVYLIAFGPALTHAVTQPVSSLGHPRLLGAALAVLIFVVPCVGAVGFHAYHTLQAYGRVKFWAKLRTYDPTPTAWDFAFGNAEPGFIRVLTKEGRWVGGYAGPNSFFSSYPEARELFLEQAWQLSDEGVFDTVIDGSAGVWIDCADAQLVQFLEEKPPTASSVDNGQKETDGEGSSG